MIFNEHVVQWQCSFDLIAGYTLLDFKMINILETELFFSGLCPKDLRHKGAPKVGTTPQVMRNKTNIQE
jgi:hypothetical protein